MRNGGQAQRRVATTLVAACVALFARPAVAELPLTQRMAPLNQGLNPRSAEGLPPELEGVGIEDKSGAAIPPDIELVDHTGRVVKTGAIFDGSTPVVLTLAYYACPMLCSMVLNGVGEMERKLAWSPGKEYRHVTVSIDPSDDTAVASAKRANYVKELGRPVDDAAYTFYTATAAESARLAAAVGFRYRWDEPTKQYLHGAGAFVLTPDGHVSRTFWGLEFPERDMRLALAEASGGKVGGAVEAVMLYCYHYDPNSKGYVLAATRVMKAGGLVTLAGLGTFLAFLWRRERRGT